MSETKPLGGISDIPGKLIVKAVLENLLVLVAAAVLYLLTWFPMGPIAVYLSKPMTNRYGERTAKHSQKYIDQGSSGWWEYWGTTIPFVRWFSSLEDSLWGESSGKWSATVKGKESTFWNKYAWVRRNPFNYIKRTNKFFACFINDCDVSYYGDYMITDKNLSDHGAHFVIAKDKLTGKTYYGFRHIFAWNTVSWYNTLQAFFVKTGNLKLTRWTGSLKLARWMDNRVYHANLGFKIKPSHADNKQDEDDLDKSFTFRVQPASLVN